MIKMSYTEKWFEKGRKPYAELLRTGGDPRVAILQDLNLARHVDNIDDMKRYLAIIYHDLLAYFRVMWDHPNFTELPAEQQKKIIEDAEKWAEEEMKRMP